MLINTLFMHQITPDFKHFQRLYRRIKPVNFKKNDQRIRPLWANKFIKFTIIGCFGGQKSPKIAWSMQNLTRHRGWYPLLCAKFHNNQCKKPNCIWSNCNTGIAVSIDNNNLMSTINVTGIISIITS